MTSTIRNIHHVEVYVSNNRQAAYFYKTVLGFTSCLTEGCFRQQPDRTTLVVGRGRIRVLLTSPITPESEVAEHIRVHGEGVKDVAFEVEDLEQVLDRAIAHGAKQLPPPAWHQPNAAMPGVARLAACGDVVHTLIEKTQATIFPIDISPSSTTTPSADTAFDYIDHIAWALPSGHLDQWTVFYEMALGLCRSQSEDVRTEYSAMRSTVVQTPDGAVRFPLMEPASGRSKSQVEGYIDSHRGPGVQHLAFGTDNIISSVRAVSRGLSVLPVPDAYYDSLPARVGDLTSELESFRRHGILVDRDPSGLLLQTFTEPLGPRPTLFLELIERRGAEGFGRGNIKALFEAVERSQVSSGST